MTDELATELGQMSVLCVIFRTSVMLYKGTAKTLPPIGREPDADAIAEGAVLRAGSRVRVTAQLIDARNGPEAGWSATLPFILYSFAFTLHPLPFNLYPLPLYSWRMSPIPRWCTWKVCASVMGSWKRCGE